MSKFKEKLEKLRPDPQIHYEDRRGASTKDQSQIPSTVIDVSDGSSVTDYTRSPTLHNTYEVSPQYRGGGLVSLAGGGDITDMIASSGGDSSRYEPQWPMMLPQDPFPVQKKKTKYVDPQWEWVKNLLGSRGYSVMPPGSSLSDLPVTALPGLPSLTGGSPDTSGFDPKLVPKPAILSEGSGNPASPLYSGDPAASVDSDQSGSNPPQGAQPPAAGQGGDELDQVQQALKDLLTPKPANLDQLSSVAQQMKPGPGDDMARFGFAMAAGQSPFFGQNAGAAGLAMLNSKQEGMKRYYDALANLQQMKESQRHDIASEKYQTADAMYRVDATRQERALNMLTRRQQTAAASITGMYREQMRQIGDEIRNNGGTPTPEAEAKKMIIQRNFYKALQSVGIVDQETLQTLADSAINVADPSNPSP